MTMLRMALLMAWSREPAARWRQAMVIVTCLMASVCALTSLSIVKVSSRADDVSAGRSLHWADDGRPAPLVASARSLTVEGHQWPVLWLEERGDYPAAARLAPPGLRRLPAPGEAVLSPGLLARGVTAESLGMRHSDAGTGAAGAIGDEGLQTRSEILVYAAPSVGRSLGEGGALLRLRGYGGEPGAAIEYDPDLPTLGESGFGALLLVLMPAAYAAISGARAVSPVRSSRSTVLFRLGISPRRVRIILAIEGLILGCVGTLVGVVVWLVGLRGVEQWPWTATRPTSRRCRRRATPAPPTRWRTSPSRPATPRPAACRGTCARWRRS